MKRYFLPFIAIAMLTLTGLSIVPGYQPYKPILMERKHLENSIKGIDALSLVNPGKIYIKDNLLFVIEKFEGIHVIDDTDPANPLFIKFITVPGIVDVSAKANLLFVDNAVDLVSIDVADLNNIKAVSRVRNVFPELPPPDANYIPQQFSISKRPANTIIVNWKNH